MNVLTKIKAGERKVVVFMVPGNLTTVDTEAEAELLALAEKGAAAEKAIRLTNGGWVTQLCVSMAKVIDDDHGCTNCAWQDFCRLRKGDNGNG